MGNGGCARLVRRGGALLACAAGALIIAACGGDDGDGEASSDAERWAGTFRTTFGELELSAGGDRVTGSYEYCGGKVAGTASGNRLTGEWTEDPEACTANQPREPGAETIGPIEFTLATDGNSFTGTWDYSDGAEGGTWGGTRVGIEDEPTAEDGEPEHEISVVFEPPRTRTESIAAKILRVGGTVGLAEGFTTSFELPVDLVVEVHRGNASPFYDPRRKAIIWTYGFVDQIARILQEAGVVSSQNDLGEQLAAVTSFVTVHELGHSFVDVFRIPITGREEDAVDGLATVFMAGEVEGGAEYAFYAARFFALLQDVQGEPNVAQFQDEHSLSIQRFYDIVCGIAGSSEENFNQVAALNVLGGHRLRRCPAEYAQKSRAWKVLLEPYLRAG